MPIIVPYRADNKVTILFFESSAKPNRAPPPTRASGGSLSFPVKSISAWLKAKIPMITTIRFKPGNRYSKSNVNRSIFRVV